MMSWILCHKLKNATALFSQTQFDFSNTFWPRGTEQWGPHLRLSSNTSLSITACQLHTMADVLKQQALRKEQCSKGRAKSGILSLLLWLLYINYVELHGAALCPTVTSYMTIFHFNSFLDTPDRIPGCRSAHFTFLTLYHLLYFTVSYWISFCVRMCNCYSVL